MTFRAQRPASRWLEAAGTLALLATSGWSTGCTDVAPADGGTPGIPRESSPQERAALVIFDDTVVHDVKLFLTDEDWQSILADSRGDQHRPVTVSVDGVVITNAGVRPSGESSRVPGNTKISLRVDFDAFDKTRELGGFESIKLSGSWDDPFLVRDQLAYWFYRQLMPAPREVSTRLTVNGEPRGVFEIEEIWSKDSLKGHFADASGTLYRLRGVAGFDPYDFVGNDPSLYVPAPWDPKGTRPLEDHAVIGPALRVLKEEPARLNEVMDVDNILTYFAASAVLSNTDGFGSGFEIDDVYEYHDPTTGRFFMLPWDPDNTLGSINDSPTRSIFEYFEKSVITRLLENELRDRYLAKLDEVMRKLPVEVLLAEADRVAGQIRPLVHEDDMKMYPTGHFEWSLGYIKEFMGARYASVRQQILDSQGAP